MEELDVPVVPGVAVSLESLDLDRIVRVPMSREEFDALPGDVVLELDQKTPAGRLTVEDHGGVEFDLRALLPAV